MTDEEVQKIAKGLTEVQRQAVLEGRVRECPYKHPQGTRCPHCSGWPFKKGGAKAFVSVVRDYLTKENEG